MILKQDFRHLLKDIDKKNTLIITDPPYNIYWGYNKDYIDKVSDEEYTKMFSLFKGFRIVIIHYIEDIIKYVVPALGVPTKVIHWVYNINLKRQSRSIAFFNCTPDLTKVKQPYKNVTDKRILKDINKGSEGCKLYDWWFVNIINNRSSEKLDYSNQIPEKIISNIIKITAEENDTIFDPFCGSGTTPAVASKLGFKYIATDISEKAYDITTKRLRKIENNLFNQ